ncbi:MAG: pyruvate dehydrogenase complex dihydrolipoamide acetyltransferase [Gemmatimonadota bacterium]|nr:pyruvate dehydrogenase complex dihydrolipoamide acetyltransferase [Gemmatimonadota bacterium]
MATKVVMEALSPTMEEGRLVKWLKNEGDAVTKGDVLAEVETDKAVMELVARGDGMLRKRLLGEGDTAPVGTLLAVIAAADENIDALVGTAAGAAKTEADGAATALAPKAEAPAAAAASGPSQGELSMPAQEQEKAQEKTPARLGNAAPRHQDPPLPQPATEQAPHAAHADGAPDDQAAGDGEGAKSSPLARRLASEGGLDLRAVRGSGPGGRIIKRDIEAAIKSGGASTAPAAPAQAPRAVAPRSAIEGDYQDVPLSMIRKTIAKRLAESIGPIPTFYLTAEFDLERVAEMRQAMAAMGDEYKVSINDIILKAVATALAQHPEVNAHWLGDKIRNFARVHIGMAVAIEEGLITPVIFDADRKRLSEISRESRDLAKRARERKLKPEEYTGSTFSVSNLGMFGIDQFTAIINPPEAGILAIGAMEEKPIVQNGEVVIRKRVRLTMSCDHRVIDGATGAKFLQTLKKMLENPLMLVY